MVIVKRRGKSVELNGSSSHGDGDGRRLELDGGRA
jgi:hypothetical protein